MARYPGESGPGEDGVAPRGSAATVQVSVVLFGNVTVQSRVVLFGNATE